MIKRALDRDFGSYDKWKKHFVATAKASRGWAILCFDPRSNRYRNISLDAHDMGNVQISIPLIVLDMYEHAYFLQYADNKAEYINKFMNNIDWEVIKARFESCL